MSLKFLEILGQSRPINFTNDTVHQILLFQIRYQHENLEN